MTGRLLARMVLAMACAAALGIGSACGGVQAASDVAWHVPTSLQPASHSYATLSYTHLRAHETRCKLRCPFFGGQKKTQISE